MTSVSEAKTLICEMCRNFYAKGWASGTGGGMSIKVNRCGSAYYNPHAGPQVHTISGCHTAPTQKDTYAEQRFGCLGLS